MKKILHIITGLDVGGAEMALFRLLKHGENFQHQVISLTQAGIVGTKISRIGIKVHSLNMRPSFSTPGAFTLLAKITKSYSPDIIHGWMYHANLISLMTRAWVSAPILWTIRQSLHCFHREKRNTRLVIKLGAFLSNFPTKILYNSHRSASQHQRLGYRKSKTMVIGNGFDIDKFIPSTEAYMEVREQLAIPADSLLIGNIARYHPVKDHGCFLEAAAKISRQKNNVYFVLIGRNVEKLQNKVNQLNIGHRVFLLGQKLDIPFWTAALNIASCSSYAEGFPNSLGEAMSCCVPCVTTDVGDASFLVGNTGITIPAKNPERLATAWNDLIENKEKRDEMAQKARKRIKDHYSIESIVQNYHACYEKLFL